MPPYVEVYHAVGVNACMHAPPPRARYPSM